MAVKKVCIFNTLKQDVVLPLQAQGTIIFVNSQGPTNHELQTCQHTIECTSPNQWKTHTVKLASINQGNEQSSYDIDSSRDQAYE
jgi:hypothetical protein